jgi:hypothetical protein
MYVVKKLREQSQRQRGVVMTVRQRAVALRAPWRISLR